MLHMQRTLSILKPDATQRHITGVINAMIEGAGLHIVAQKRLRMTLRQAEEFYAEHSARPFFGDLCSYMSSGPVVVQVLQGDEAIVRYRTLMGATNPLNADEGTIRKHYGISIDHNTVHGSDGEEAAAREIAFFFRPEEILPS